MNQTVKIVPAPGHLIDEVLVACGRVGLRVIRRTSGREAYGEVSHDRIVDLREVPGVQRIETLRELG